MATIVLAITGVFGSRAGAGGTPPNDKGILKNWLDRLANALKRLAGKAAEALPANVESVVGAILSCYFFLERPLVLWLNIHGPLFFLL